MRQTGKVVHYGRHLLAFGQSGGGTDAGAKIDAELARQLVQRNEVLVVVQIVVDILRKALLFVLSELRPIQIQLPLLRAVVSNSEKTAFEYLLC